MQRLLICLIIAEVFCSWTVNAYTKRWIFSTDWDDARNWDKQRVPCVNDQIVLSNGTMYMSKNATITNMALPLSGEIIFGDNTEITFESPQQASTKPSKACPGEPIRFIGNEPKDWFNPTNWAFVENNIVAPWNNGTLFMDRIPCKTDQVTFPESNAFSIGIDKDVSVSQIFIETQSFSREKLRTYFQSSEGRNRFKLASNVKVEVSQGACRDKAGCVCGYAQMKKVICGKFNCPADCENKVTPEGDCCSRCGAIVKMKIRTKFDLSSCQNILRANLIKTAYSGAVLYMSPLATDGTIDRVQILLTDSNDGSIALGAANYLKGNVDRLCGGYDVSVVSTRTGGGTVKPPAKSTADKKTNNSTVALAVVLTLVLVLVGLGGAYLLFRRRRGSFDIKRQVLHDEMNIAGVHDLELADTDFNAFNDFNIDVFGIPNEKGGAFENPLYEEVGKNGGVAVLPVSRDIETKTDPNSNVYSESQKTSAKKDKKKKKKKNSSNAFDNPVYSQEDFSQGLDDTFDEPVPKDDGIVNPIYFDMYATGNNDVVDLSAPPSFLDAFDDYVTDKDATEVVNGTCGAGNEKVKITISEALVPDSDA